MQVVAGHVLVSTCRLQGLCDEMLDYTKTACDLSSRDPVVILGKMLTTNNITVGEFVCALQKNVQPSKLLPIS